MSRIPQQLTMAVIIGNRGFSQAIWLLKPANKPACSLRDWVLKPLCSTIRKRNSAGRNPPDAKVCAELFRAHRDDIHGVVVLLPNFGDEKQ